MSDFQAASVGIEDLLAEEEEVVSGNGPASIKAGIATSVTEDRRPRDPKQDPSSTRWVFNPFEVIDLRNLGASCGLPYLYNGVFNEIKSIPTSVRKSDPYKIASAPQGVLGGNEHNNENYERFDRTAYMITRELQEHHGDKGVVEIEVLRGDDSASANDLNALMFGDEIPCVTDLNHPEFPCPVLPNVLERLQENVREAVKRIPDGKERQDILTAAKQVRDGIALAIRNARFRINEAQKRLLDDKNPNRKLSPAEERCYLALGEEIPNQMPFLTKSAVAGQGAGIDGAAIGRGITEALINSGVIPGQVAGGAENKDLPPLPPVGDDAQALVEKIDFNVDESELEEAECTPEAKSGKGKKKTANAEE